MKKIIPILFFLFAAYSDARSQNINPPENMGGGEYVFEKSECLSNDQRMQIKAMLKTNVEQLVKQGKLQPAVPSKVAATKFKWPLKQMAAYDYNYYYGISNYVDHNNAYPNQLQDYNCGTRTYDNASGYNHQGTDIFIWPFSWLQMQRKQVKIVAGAPGIIIGKSDGNADKSCGFNNNNWNAVYIQHADGSVAWYGHMKKNSLTAKNVGDAVAANEKLGFVGSSGNSTGPHLHFEVYDAGNVLVDPWKGTCNNITSSWWSKQKPYYESKLNTILTQSDAPVFPDCPNVETTNESTSFIPGNRVYFASYYHDQQAGQVTKYTVTRPNKTVFAQWTGSSSVTYAASYWYWWYTLPANAPAGTWQYQAIFQGDTLARTFTVVTSFAVNDIKANTKIGNDFILSPNPVANNLKIEITGEVEPAYYKIYDANGRLYHQGIFNKNESNIPVTGLQKGVYCLKLSRTDGSTLFIKKFVKL
ncbi:MAG TPA: peptidoglycan DD-metalloendopeptidase family protein [Parafilimonas sp.]|nr:peptidoglycan DD-metalloendopeptidase family protein [Parafilimonas sp.]